MSQRGKHKLGRGYSSENFNIEMLKGGCDESYSVEAVSDTIITSVKIVKHSDSTTYRVRYRSRHEKTYENFPPSTLGLPSRLKHKEETVRQEMEEIQGLLSKLGL